MARKACGADGVLHGFTDLTPADVEKIVNNMLKQMHGYVGFPFYAIFVMSFAI